MLRTHVEIGEQVVEKIHLDKQQVLEKEGTVIWIHPKGRFYRVRFEGKRGPVTESYHLGRKFADSGDRI